MVPARTIEDFEGAFSTISLEHVDGFLVVDSPLTVAHRARLAELALKHPLPSMFGSKENVETGGLMNYGTDFNDLLQRAARADRPRRRGDRVAVRLAAIAQKKHILCALFTL